MQQVNQYCVSSHSASGQAQSKKVPTPVVTTETAAATAPGTGWGNATDSNSNNKPSIRKRVSRFSPRQTRRSGAASTTKVSVANFAEAGPVKSKKTRKRAKKQADKENQPVSSSILKKDTHEHKNEKVKFFENKTESAQIEDGSSNCKN